MSAVTRDAMPLMLGVASIALAFGVGLKVGQRHDLPRCYEDEVLIRDTVPGSAWYCAPLDDLVADGSAGR